MTYNEKDAIEATRLDRKLLFHVHPYSARLMELIRKPDVVKIPQVGAVVNDADLIRKVFLDKNNFSKIGKGVSSALWTPIIGETGLLNMDGDPHIKMRRELASSFSQKVIPMLVEEVFTEHIASLFETLPNGGQVDLTAVSSELAYRTLWKLLGFKETDNVDFEEETKILRSVTEGVELHRKELPAKQIEQAKQKLVFVEKMVDKAYSQPIPGSVINVMKTSGYSLEEVNSITKSLMVTGTETIISYIPRMVALFVRSGFMKDLTRNPNLLDNALDEAFRVTVPTPVAARSVTHETTLGGHKLLPGQRVVLATISACQRYGHFNPYKPIDKSLKGLWFGAGTHMCIGLPIAKAQAQLVAKTLIQTGAAEQLEIVEAQTSRRGHTGSYSKLIIQKRPNI